MTIISQRRSNLDVKLAGVWASGPLGFESLLVSHLSFGMANSWWMIWAIFPRTDGEWWRKTKRAEFIHQGLSFCQCVVSSPEVSKSSPPAAWSQTCQVAPSHETERDSESWCWWRCSTMHKNRTGKRQPAQQSSNSRSYQRPFGPAADTRRCSAGGIDPAAKFPPLKSRRKMPSTEQPIPSRHLSLLVAWREFRWQWRPWKYWHMPSPPTASCELAEPWDWVGGHRLSAAESDDLDCHPPCLPRRKPWNSSDPRSRPPAVEMNSWVPRNSRSWIPGMEIWNEICHRWKEEHDTTSIGYSLPSKRNVLNTDISWHSHPTSASQSLFMGLRFQWQSVGVRVGAHRRKVGTRVALLAVQVLTAETTQVCEMTGADATLFSQKTWIDLDWLFKRCKRNAYSMPTVSNGLCPEILMNFGALQRICGCSTFPQCLNVLPPQDFEVFESQDLEEDCWIWQLQCLALHLAFSVGSARCLADSPHSFQLPCQGAAWQIPARRKMRKMRTMQRCQGMSKLKCRKNHEKRSYMWRCPSRIVSNKSNQVWSFLFLKETWCWIIWIGKLFWVFPGEVSFVRANGCQNFIKANFMLWAALSWLYFPEFPREYVRACMFTSSAEDLLAHDVSL